MAVKMTTADLLKDYFSGVLSRADHHAKSVREICLTLMGAVIWKSEGDIEVKEVNKNNVEGVGNILWFHTVSGSRYALYYNHGTHDIELRDRTYKGETLAIFNNSTPPSEVYTIFSTL